MILRDRHVRSRILARGDEGQTMAEYAFVLGLVMLAAVVAFTSLGEACLRLLEPVVKAVAP